MLNFSSPSRWALLLLGIALQFLSQTNSLVSDKPRIFGIRQSQTQFHQLTSSRKPLTRTHAQQDDIENASTSSQSSFSLSNLFGKGAAASASTSGLRGSNSATAAGPASSSLQSTGLEVHPSVRPHISPLNRLAPTFPKAPTTLSDDFTSTTSLSNSLLPVHPDVRSGILDNGLSYVILPNKSPPGRFEAHLQVFSGSADELEPQQGIAHLTEHVAYMGSRKRERLFGTGSQTNAYTDFHHTVFYAACPVRTVTGVTMLPMALDALVDVMEARVESSRLEKERAAVLSEMTMVNTIEYRVECQILGTLHRENRLAKRFPIGKESLIRSWKTDDVRTWHRTHYRPDNVLLYVVGDIDADQVEECVREKFSHITSEKQATEIKIPALRAEASLLADAVVEGTVKAGQSWHYPPVRHTWCALENQIPANDLGTVNTEYDIHLQNSYPLDEKVDVLSPVEVAPGKEIQPHIFRHELLQAFSLHLFAKRPVDRVYDLPSFQTSLARRIALAALQIRLNVGGRSDDPACSFVEFNQLDSAREGCAVCSLDMTSEPSRWKDAVYKSVSEIRKLGLYGVTAGEMERYASSLMTDAEQLAAQNDRISHGDQLAYLMETIANGHTFMSPLQSYEVTSRALRTLTLEQVNNAARELCSHILSLRDSEPGVSGPIIAVACAPKGIDPSNEQEYCDEQSLVQAIYDACQLNVEPEIDVVVPRSLIPEEELTDALMKFPPSWTGGTFTDGTPPTASDTLTKPFTLRRLSNGIRVGIAANPAESQRGHLKMVATGGRDAEQILGFKRASMSIGARTMQEGGAFGPWTREQVELFCVDHLLMVEINCNEESLTFDFVFPTTNVGNVGFGDDVQLGITGTESVMQIVREIIVGFKWEQDAFGRSKQSFKSSYESLQKNLEGLSTERIAEVMTDNDHRFLSIDVESINDITLEDVKHAVMSQLQPSNLEISLSGDFDVVEVLEMIYKFVGTIPADANSEYKKPAPKALPEWAGRVPTPAVPGQFVELELVDPDPRAVAYVSGAAPNAWGFLSDGTTVAEKVIAADKKKMTDFDRRRRSHPLFANAALLLLSEIINRRLFSTVRERKQLTYDANFSFSGFERLLGGWFLVTVTASKDKAVAALEACKETIHALRKSNPITPDNVESAKRVVLNRHESDLRTTSYWAHLMSGIQQESIPLKGPLSVTDFHAVVESITARDLQLVLDAGCIGFDDNQLYSAIGKTVLPAGVTIDDKDLLQGLSPAIGMRRGGALMG